MKNITSRILLFCIVAFLISPNTGKAQRNKHEISVWGSTGLSTLKYDLSFGKRSDDIGGNVGLGYTYLFSEHFGIGTGAEIAWYRAKAKVDGLKDTYKTLDYLEFEPVEIRSTFNNHKEHQRLTTINIPLMLQYEVGKFHKFYAAIGGKIGIPINSATRASNSDIKVSGYYYETTLQELFDPYFAGYGRYAKSGKKDDLDFKLSYIGTAEIGAKWDLKRSVSLYTGAYFEYGFNDIYDGRKDKNFLEHSKSSNINSVISSQHTSSGVTKSFVEDKVNLFAVGLKVRLAFGTKCDKQTYQEPAVGVFPAPEANNKIEEEYAKLKAEAEAKLESDRLAAEKAKEEAEKERLRLEAEKAEKDKLEKAKLDIHTVIDHFELGKWQLTPKMKKELDAKIAIINSHPEVKVSCVSHTCNIGTDVTNLKISNKRAESVRQYLISKGVKASRISTDFKGEREPRYPNTTNENRLKNRRVEIVISENQ